MIIDCISDLHGNYPRLGGGDLLIVAGDLANGTLGQVKRLKDWLIFCGFSLYKKVIFIAGNHDNWIQDGIFFSRDEDVWDHPNVTYLEDSGTEFSYFEEGYPEEDEGFLPSGHRTLKIWGSPWTRRFEGMNPKCMAFTVDTDEELAEKWARIPDDTGILVTHCAPYGIFDRAVVYIKSPENDLLKGFKHVGSDSLHKKTCSLSPILHCFGHVHEGYMQKELGDIHFVNASHVNERYEPVNKPIRVIL